MTLQTIREPYELLIRWKGGVVSGLHKRELITVKDDGVVLSETEGKALPLEISDVPNFFPATDAIANVSRLLNEKAELESRVLNLEGQLEKARMKIAAQSQSAGEAS